jgi:hypothetical protein
MRFVEFMAGQEIDSILGNVSKQATPQQQAMFQSAQPFIKTSAQQHGPQAVQSAVQDVLGQMSGQNQGQAGQTGQTMQQGQMGQRPQNNQQPQTGQQTQMPQTNKVEPNQSKAFKDMLQKSLNNWNQNQTAQNGQNGQQTNQNANNPVNGIFNRMTTSSQNQNI